MVGSNIQRGTTVLLKECGKEICNCLNAGKAAGVFALSHKHFKLHVHFVATTYT